MIMNERQYKITKGQLDKFLESLKIFDVDLAVEKFGARVLAIAHRNALASEIDVLSSQLEEYEELKSGAITTFETSSLAELPTLLIRARIARGFTQSQLADLINVNEQQIQRYESESYASASLRRLIEVSSALKLDIKEIAELQPEPYSSYEDNTSKLDWAKFPIKEMYKRKWFKGFTGTLHNAKKQGPLLIENFLRGVDQEPVLSMHRQRMRSGSKDDKYALLAWEYRVLTIADSLRLDGQFDHEALTEQWFRQLANESRFRDGPIRARNFLSNYGISLVIEPHLPRTHLDGAAFLFKSFAVIGLTLRHDRTDNFWFVLFHELVHIAKHLRKGKLEAIFDDLDDPVGEIEMETDEIAGNMLLPNEEWDNSLARFTKSNESIISLANKLEISPSIIAGRIRKEEDNYIILKDIVGFREVRKLFPEIVF